MGWFAKKHEAISVRQQAWTYETRMGGTVHGNFFKNPDASSPIAGILLTRTDSDPSPQVTLSIIGNLNQAKPTMADHITLRDPKQFPEIATFLGKKFHSSDCLIDLKLVTEEQVQIASVMNLPAPPSDKSLAAKFPSSALTMDLPSTGFIATQIYNADIELLPMHSQLRASFEEGVRDEIRRISAPDFADTRKIDAYAKAPIDPTDPSSGFMPPDIEAMDPKLGKAILKEAQRKNLIPRASAKAREYETVLKILEDAPVISHNKNMRHALVSAISDVISPGKVAAGFTV